MAFLDKALQIANKAWELGGNITKKAGEVVGDFNQDVARYQERYQYLSKEELLHKWHQSSSFAEKSAIGGIFKKNGWTQPKDEKP